MSATATSGRTEIANRERRRKRAGILIRRIPDEDGTLVTYLPASELHKVIGCSSTTIGRWMRMGAIRTTDKLVGMRNAALVDAARLRLMTPAQSLALGIRRIPVEELRQQAGWFAKEQHITLKRADHHRERWDDYDIQFVVTCVEQGRPLEIIAKALGRTYASVDGKVSDLRAAGDLPESPRGNGRRVDREGCLKMVRHLLTPEELQSLG